VQITEFWCRGALQQVHENRQDQPFANAQSDHAAAHLARKSGKFSSVSPQNQHQESQYDATYMPFL